MSTNDFKVFCEAAENMLSQAMYEASDTRANGYTPGIVYRNLINKVLHQSSIMAAAIGAVIAEKGIDASDSDINMLASAVKDTFGGQKVYYSFADVNSSYSAGTAISTVLGAMDTNSVLYASVTSNTYYPAAGAVVFRKTSVSTATGTLITTTGATYDLYAADITASVVKADWKLPTPGSHNHNASDINSGTLAIARGGTGASDAGTARSNLGITPSNIGAAAASHNHSADDINAGTLPIARGGTGGTTKIEAWKGITQSTRNTGITNLDELEDGVYSIVTTTSTNADLRTALGGTGTGSVYAFLVQMSDTNGSKFQIAYRTANTYTAYRGLYGGNWTPWVRMVSGKDMEDGAYSGVRTTTSGTIASGASSAITVTNSGKCLVNLLGASDYNNYLTVTKTSTTKLTIKNTGSGVAGYQVVEYY